MNAPAKEYDGMNKYIRITDIDEGTYTYKYDDVVSPNAQLENKYKVQKNDILFARTGASTGKAYLYDKKDGLMYYAGFLIRGNVKPDFNSKFVFLQTQTQKYKKWVDIMSIRSGQPGINSQEYSSFEFHLPPSKAEQDKIAKIKEDRISKAEKTQKEKKILSEVVNQIIEFFVTNRTNVESLKPVLLRCKELGYDNPKDIDDINVAKEIFAMIKE
jgi:type I restriction enzyme S subunit